RRRRDVERAVPGALAAELRGEPHDPAGPAELPGPVRDELPGARRGDPHRGGADPGAVHAAAEVPRRRPPRWRRGGLRPLGPGPLLDRTTSSTGTSTPSAPSGPAVAPSAPPSRRRARRAASAARRRVSWATVVRST